MIDISVLGYCSAPIEGAWIAEPKSEIRLPISLSIGLLTPEVKDMNGVGRFHYPRKDNRVTKAPLYSNALMSQKANSR